jgi:hypothetical protein
MSAGDHRLMLDLNDDNHVLHSFPDSSLSISKVHVESVLQSPPLTFPTHFLVLKSVCTQDQYQRPPPPFPNPSPPSMISENV